MKSCRFQKLFTCSRCLHIFIWVALIILWYANRKRAKFKTNFIYSCQTLFALTVCMFHSFLSILIGIAWHAWKQCTVHPYNIFHDFFFWSSKTVIQPSMLALFFRNKFIYFTWKSCILRFAPFCFPDQFLVDLCVK